MTTLNSGLISHGIPSAVCTVHGKTFVCLVVEGERWYGMLWLSVMNAGRRGGEWDGVGAGRKGGRQED